MSVKVEIPDGAAREITRQFLSEHVIIMKQYLNEELREHYLEVIKRHSSLMEYADFIERYERAHG